MEKNLFRLIDSLNPANIEMALQIATHDPALEQALKDRYFVVFEDIFVGEQVDLDCFRRLSAALGHGGEYCAEQGDLVTFYAELGEWESVERIFKQYAHSMQVIRGATLLNYVFERNFEEGRISNISIDGGGVDLKLAADWAHWKYIQNFWMENFTAIDDFASIFPSMKHLWSFGLVNCGLERFPETAADIPSLSHLILNENRFQTIPAEIRNFEELFWLEMAGNQIETIPDWLGQMRELGYLNIENNRLTYLPGSLFYSPHLKTINAPGNQISQLQLLNGQFLDQITHFDLERNPLAEFPLDLLALKGLSWLNLDQCNLQTMPEEIGQLLNLETLSLIGNPLKSLPDGICHLINLTFLRLGDCNLDALPDRIGDLQKLESLSMNFPTLGDFPPSMQALTSLRGLYLGPVDVDASRAVIEKLIAWLPYCDICVDEQVVARGRKKDETTAND